ncbi:MAG: glycosyltransferase family 2 protein [Thermoanaerobaculia bacterium]|jgi:glycosyltransferase involved in cell wall biosynthesis
MISLVIPVYCNSGNIPALVDALESLDGKLGGELEVVFVVDGSPDDSYLQLAARLPAAGFSSQLVSLSRNFGSFAAIRAGLRVARGDRFAVIAADLQEPPELIVEFNRILLAGEHDVVVGQRTSRRDPMVSRLSSSLFWATYRQFVQPEVPAGGVDVFGCTRKVRDELLQLDESNSSLVGLLLWVGFRRAAVPYERRERTIGKSAWTLRKKVRYLMDSVFGFSDLPIRLLLRIGLLGIAVACVFGATVVVARVVGAVPVPGYAATVFTITFFGGLNCFGLGIIGAYVWRTFENTKHRPNYVVASHRAFNGDRDGTSGES